MFSLALPLNSRRSQVVHERKLQATGRIMPLRDREIGELIEFVLKAVPNELDFKGIADRVDGRLWQDTVVAGVMTYRNKVDAIVRKANGPQGQIRALLGALRESLPNREGGWPELSGWISSLENAGTQAAARGATFASWPAGAATTPTPRISRFVTAVGWLTLMLAGALVVGAIYLEWSPVSVPGTPPEAAIDANVAVGVDAGGSPRIDASASDGGRTAAVDVDAGVPDVAADAGRRARTTRGIRVPETPVPSVR